MTLFLLTHPRELTKKTNTGRLVLEMVGSNAQVIVWERKKPNAELLALIEQGNVVLLYPSEDSQAISDADNFEHYIIIDGTWQEARKIYNQSPYLRSLPRVVLTLDKPSAFHLRRNQKEKGLCTAECAIELWTSQRLTSLADSLQQTFDAFVAKK